MFSEARINDGLLANMPDQGSVDDSSTLFAWNCFSLPRRTPQDQRYTLAGLVETKFITLMN
jgi:hypothetical protein